ncbi:MAG: peptide deformylase [Actinobacteria bacterium]|nr:MAG: peptide deformylase [Actinomycetota bacterium]
MAEAEDVTTEEEQRDPEQEARRRLALAQIRQYPDPVLRMKAREVETFDDELVRLVQRMSRLMHDAVGVGLAATQVGILRRVLVFQRQPEGEDAEPETLAVVNPSIVERGDETEVDDEGCLSLQGVHVPVERSTRVTLEGTDEHGRPVRYELEDLSARVVEHEVDHLDGTLILDRTTDEARREALGTLRPRLA